MSVYLGTNKGDISSIGRAILHVTYPHPENQGAVDAYTEASTKYLGLDWPVVRFEDITEEELKKRRVDWRLKYKAHVAALQDPSKSQEDPFNMAFGRFIAIVNRETMKRRTIEDGSAATKRQKTGDGSAEEPVQAVPTAVPTAVEVPAAVPTAGPVIRLNAGPAIPLTTGPAIRPTGLVQQGFIMAYTAVKPDGKEEAKMAYQHVKTSILSLVLNILAFTMPYYMMCKVFQLHIILGFFVLAGYYLLRYYEVLKKFYWLHLCLKLTCFLFTTIFLVFLVFVPTMCLSFYWVIFQLPVALFNVDMAKKNLILCMDIQLRGWAWFFKRTPVHFLTREFNTEIQWIKQTTQAK